jgi:Bacterial capsule synthesis protein PGA_cap
VAIHTKPSQRIKNPATTLQLILKWEHLAMFHAADFRLCNLECVMADHGRPWSVTPKLFHFRSDAKNMAVLKAARIECVSLANNHTLDFEDTGPLEMLQILDEAGIGHAALPRIGPKAHGRPPLAGHENLRGFIIFTAAGVALWHSDFPPLRAETRWCLCALAARQQPDAPSLAALLRRDLRASEPFSAEALCSTAADQYIYLSH